MPFGLRASPGQARRQISRWKRPDLPRFGMGASGRGESHPPVLSEPDVTISRHPAPTGRPLLEACEQHNVAVEAYSSLGTGRHLDDRSVKAVAQRVGRTPAQVLLRWFFPARPLLSSLSPPTASASRKTCRSSISRCQTRHGRPRRLRRDRWHRPGRGAQVVVNARPR